MTICINSNTSNSNDELFCQTCGSLLLIKGRYRPIRQLGTGGFGTTYEIIDIQDQNTKKVLKVLRNNSEKAIQLFKREARFLASNNHPGIPKADSNGYFQFEPKDRPQPLHCLIMEKIEGMNLKEYMKQLGKPIKENLALRWLKEIVEILDRVHSQNIIHRDIKPQNIMLQPNGKLTLIDFGAVTDEGIVEEDTQTATATSGTEATSHLPEGTRIFSKGYAAPEQIEGKAIKQSDIYSLGRTFVYLLTAKEPNDPIMYDSFNDRVNWQSHAQGVSPQLADLIDGMIQRVAAKRPAKTRLILQKLQQIGGVAKRGGDIGVSLGISEREAAAGTQKKINVSRWININGHRQPETTTLTVTIPAGVKQGQKMRLQGQGDAGEYGGENGDVYVRLSVDKTASFNNDSQFDKVQYEYAPLWKRLLAMVIDLILIFIVFWVSIAIFINMLGADDITAVYGAILCTFIFYYSCGSFGKKIFRLKVVTKNNKKVNFGRSFVRLIIKIINFFPGFTIPFGIILLNKQKRGIHDFISGTIVVKNNN